MHCVVEFFNIFFSLLRFPHLFYIGHHRSPAPVCSGTTGSIHNAGLPSSSGYTGRHLQPIVIGRAYSVIIRTCDLVRYCTQIAPQRRSCLCKLTIRTPISSSTYASLFLSHFFPFLTLYSNRLFPLTIPPRLPSVVAHNSIVITTTVYQTKRVCPTGTSWIWSCPFAARM